MYDRIIIFYLYFIYILGQVIGGYWGDYFNDEMLDIKYKKPEDQKNIFTIDMKKGYENLYIDGSEACTMSYVNDAYQSQYTNNSKFVQMRNREYKSPKFITLVATSDIKVGREILAYYGNMYWSKFNFFYIFRRNWKTSL